ncbi:MAG: hypothetical protein AAGD13_02700 [Pseudomonadota bacterium]
MSPTVPSILDRICAAVLMILTALVLARLLFGQDWADIPSRIMALVLMLVVMPRFGTREWVLLALSCGLAAGLWMKPGGWPEAGFALRQGAYFTAFILMMMTLREAAVTSASVLKVGDWTTRQPPAKRYVAMWVSGHVAGILLNFGAVSLLAPLIQRGVRARPIDTPEEELRARTRERRQISALIRGFSVVITWAPTTLTQVIIFAAIPGLDLVQVIAMALALGLVMLAVGWTEDLLTWGKPRMAIEQPEPFPWRAGLDLLFVYALLVFGAWAVVEAAGVSLPQALMTVAPVMLVGWVLVQSRGGPIESAPARLREIALVSVPKMAREAYLLGAAGFIGISAAKLAPVDAIAAWAEQAQLPGWAIVAALPLIITLGGQIALSPMMMVVFLAAVVSALPVLPAAPEYVALALSFGWALSMTAAPNATGALLLAGTTGIPPTTLTWRWNGVYSIAALVVFALLCRLVVGG